MGLQGVRPSTNFRSNNDVLGQRQTRPPEGGLATSSATLLEVGGGGPPPSSVIPVRVTTPWGMLRPGFTSVR